MKKAIKREQRQAVLGSAERELFGAKLKKTLKFLTMTALALTGAVMTGCSNDDEIQQPKDNVVTLKTTVSISGGEATTRALTTDGVKTFAAGEKIAVIYTNTSNETVKVESEALKDDGDITTTGDASTNKKTATFTVTLTNPKAGGEVRYIYPAAMAATTVTTTTPVTGDATVNYAALNTQNGTMANISANLDFAKFDGSLTASAGLPASPTLVNQLAICEFTIKNAAGTDITSTLTNLTMANGGNTYTVSPSSLSKIYVAVKPVTSGDITFTATDNATFNYNRNQSGKTLAAGNLYPISFKMTKEKKNASVTAPTAVAASFTYSGSAQTLFSAGSTTGGTMKYKVTTTNSKPASTADFKTTIDQGTNAGTYYLWYYVDGGDNYNTTDVNGTAVTKAIGKAAATLTCSNDAISFSSTEATNSTKTKTGVSCTGGTINVASANTGNCTVSYSSGTITVTRKTNSAFTNTQITVSVTPDGNHTAPSNVTFNVSAAAYDTGIALSSVTNSHVGYVIGNNSKIYVNATAATNAGTTARAIIAYVGSAGSVDASSATYKGLAIAMNDANSGSTCNWYSANSGTCVSQSSAIATVITYKNGIASTNTLTSDGHGHTHAAATAARSNNSTAHPTGTSDWFLPSMGQWNLIVQGLATKKAGSAVTTNLAGSTNDTYMSSNLNSVITNAGGTGFKSDNYYWSSSEYATSYAWVMNFNYGNSDGWYKNYNCYVRSVLAF